MGQLLKAAGDTTYTYTYDGFGNILTANGHTYTYGNTGWRDLLTAFDGQSITYDASGNPTSYYNGTRWTFGWSEGRNLVSASGNSNTVTYAYDHNGVRTTKTVNGTVHTYTYASGKLLRETYGNNTLDFFYDASGAPFALKHNGTLYYYITNLQGDVMQLVNSSGTAVATYEYDPYGNIVSSSGSMAEINPLRYRGYYFDSETGFYYLQSRYYDPAIGRFLNHDVVYDYDAGLQGFSLFAYCGNNPTNRIDISGADSNGIGEGEDLLDEAVLEGGGAGNGKPAGGSGGSGYPATSVPSETYGPPQTANTSPGSYNFGGSKGVAYAVKRGWSHDMIMETISAGQTGASTNLANGAECAVYGNATQYVVIESASRNIVQLTQIGDSGWIADNNIMWFYGSLSNGPKSIY